MKRLFFLPLLFVLATANEQEILKRNEEVLNNVLKQLESTTFDLPKEVIQKLNEIPTAVGPRAIDISSIVDAYVDRLLKNLQKYLLKSGYDPVEVPGATLELLGLGSITLSSGWMQDTSLIERNGNTTLSYNSGTKILSLDLPIKFSTLLVTYKYLTKVILLQIDGNANAKIKDLKIHLGLSYDFNTYQASLDTFEIRDSGRFSLTFTGNGLVDSVTNAMTAVVTVFLQPIVIRIIELMVKGNLENVVEEINDAINSIFNP